MKIHGIAYLIIGAFVTGFSYYITSVNEALDVQKFSLFIWTGIVFMVIGAFKLLLGLKDRKPKPAKENHPHHQPHPNAKHPESHTNHPSAHHPAHIAEKQKNPHIKHCSNCGAALRSFDKFCYKCGSRAFSH